MDEKIIRELEAALLAIHADYATDASDALLQSGDSDSLDYQVADAKAWVASECLEAVRALLKDRCPQCGTYPDTSGICDCGNGADPGEAAPDEQERPRVVFEGVIVG